MDKQSDELYDLENKKDSSSESVTINSEKGYKFPCSLETVILLFLTYYFCYSFSRRSLDYLVMTKIISGHYWPEIFKALELGVQTLIYFSLVGYIFYLIKIRNKSPLSVIGLCPPPSISWFFVSIFISTLLIFLSYILLDLGNVAAPAYSAYWHKKPSPLYTILEIIAVVIYGPLFEEILFRGFWYSSFKKYFGNLSGMVISTLLFTVIHFDFPPAIVFSRSILLPKAAQIFLHGMIFCFLYNRYRSLVPSIMTHAFCNIYTICIIRYNLDFL